MAKRALEPCPRCESTSVELTDRKSALNGAVGTTAIGLLLSLAYAPVLIMVVPAAIYLVYSALRAKPTLTCFDCKHRWPAREAVAEPPDDES